MFTYKRFSLGRPQLPLLISIQPFLHLAFFLRFFSSRLASTSSSVDLSSFSMRFRALMAYGRLLSFALVLAILNLLILIDRIVSFLSNKFFNFPLRFNYLPFSCTPLIMSHCNNFSFENSRLEYIDRNLPI